MAAGASPSASASLVGLGAGNNAAAGGAASGGSAATPALGAVIGVLVVIGAGVFVYRYRSKLAKKGGLTGGDGDWSSRGAAGAAATVTVASPLSGSAKASRATFVPQQVSGASAVAADPVSRSWVACHNKKDGSVYYHNSMTKETVWDLPPGVVATSRMEQ